VISAAGDATGTITVAAASVGTGVKKRNRGDYGMSFNKLNMMSLNNLITIHAVFTKA
jgi:hypothetical protein